MKTIKLEDKPYVVLVEEHEDYCILHTGVYLPFKGDPDYYMSVRLQFGYLGLSDQIISNFTDYIDNELIKFYNESTIEDLVEKQSKLKPGYTIAMYDKDEVFNRVDEIIKVIPKEYLEKLTLSN